MNLLFVPVPEHVTPMIQGEISDGTEGYFDVTGNWSCFFAIDTDEAECVGLYALDMLGAGEIEAKYIMIPTIHCKRCGARMRADDAHSEREAQETTRRCYCGATYSPETGWNVPLV